MGGGGNFGGFLLHEYLHITKKIHKGEEEVEAEGEEDLRSLSATEVRKEEGGWWGLVGGGGNFGGFSLHEHLHIMKKIHKGEEEVEAEGEEDLSSLSTTEVRKEEGGWWGLVGEGVTLLHEHLHITKKTDKVEEEVSAVWEEDLSSLSATEVRKEEGGWGRYVTWG